MICSRQLRYLTLISQETMSHPITKKKKNKKWEENMQGWNTEISSVLKFLEKEKIICLTNNWIGRYAYHQHLITPKHITLIEPDSGFEVYEFLP